MIVVSTVGKDYTNTEKTGCVEGKVFENIYEKETRLGARKVLGGNRGGTEMVVSASRTVVTI